MRSIPTGQLPGLGKVVPTGQCYGRMGRPLFKHGEYGDLVKRNDFEWYHCKYIFVIILYICREIKEFLCARASTGVTEYC